MQVHHQEVALYERKKSLSSVSTVPAGSASKAAFTGANTVNGPFPLQRLNQTGGLDCRDQCGVILRVNGVLDDVLVWIGLC